ncbi:uncharacterized protein LOC119411767, partial [Nematolebias whitei]|uniref:uncharacterized protein LOC119411767 n=1 Tax=Nematolebias whitei TaxID=451745 RepID=UPI0018990B5C
WGPGAGLAQDGNKRDQKIIAPTRNSEEVFFSDTSPQTSPQSTGASVFLSPTFSKKLKHSRSWSTKSLQIQEPHHSRGLGSVDESDEWAEKKVDRLSPLSYDHTKFYKRMVSSKDSRELSSPKKTGETFPKAKEQHTSLKMTGSQAQGAAVAVSRSIMPPMSNTKIPTVRSDKAQAGPQVVSTLHCAMQQQGQAGPQVVSILHRAGQQQDQAGPQVVSTSQCAGQQGQAGPQVVSTLQRAGHQRGQAGPQVVSTLHRAGQQQGQAGLQVVSTLQRTGHQQGHHRRLKDSSRKESLGTELKNSERENQDMRRYTIGSGERPSFEKESFKRRVRGESHPHRTLPIKESETCGNKDLEHKDVNGKSKPTENKKVSKETNKRDSLSFFKDIWSRKDSPTERKERKGKSSNSKEDFVASTTIIQGSSQSPKGSVSPGPWRVPNSVKILTEQEVFRDPL